MNCPTCGNVVEPGSANAIEDVRGRWWCKDCALEVLAGAALAKVEAKVEVPAEAEPAVEAPKPKKWKCRGCGYTADEKWLGRCEGCGRMYDIVANRYTSEEKGTSITELSAKPERRISTKIDGLDEVFGGEAEHDKPGGLVVGATFVLAGSPGGGKSTISLQIAGNIASEKRGVFYVSAEEHSTDVAGTAKRIGVTNPHIQVHGVDRLGGQEIEEVLLEVERLKPRVLIYDSITKGRSAMSAADVGSTGQSLAVLKAIYHYTKTANLCSLVLSQINNAGEVKGGVSLEHDSDGVLGLFPWDVKSGDYCSADESDHRKILIGKNRKGRSGTSAIFLMTAEGMVEVVPEEPKQRKGRRFRD